MLRPGAEALKFCIFESFIWDFPSRAEGLQVLSAPCCILVSYIDFLYFMTLGFALTFCPFIWELFFRKGCDRNVTRRQNQSPIFWVQASFLVACSYILTLWTCIYEHWKWWWASIGRYLDNCWLWVVPLKWLWVSTAFDFFSREREHCVAPLISVGSDLKCCRWSPDDAWYRFFAFLYRLESSTMEHLFKK